MEELKITRVVTEVEGNVGVTMQYHLNGHGIWVGHRIKEAGLSEGPFSKKLNKVCVAIARDNPGFTVDMKDPVIAEFLKATGCV